MNRARLNELVAEFGVKVDHVHQGAGKFVDLYIGIGADPSVLAALHKAIIREMGYKNLIKIDQVNNPDHEDYGKRFLNVESFWNE